MEKNEYKSLTIHVYGKYVQVKNDKGIMAIASCNPIDTFNLHTGIDLALQRLEKMEKKQQKEIAKMRFRPYVCGNCYFPHDATEFNGYIGEETTWVDEFGEKLKVGDTVKVKTNNARYFGCTTIVKIPAVGTAGVMGLGDMERERMFIVKIPRKNKTRWCTLVNSYKQQQEMMKKQNAK